MFSLKNLFAEIIKTVGDIGMNKFFARSFGLRHLFGIALLTTLMSIEATASSVDQATIIHIFSVAGTNLKQQDGVLLLGVSPAPTGLPTCATASDHQYAVNAATDSGKTVISTILSAQAQGLKIKVYGTGACDIWSDSESIYFVETE